jgi:RNA polymerase-binding transcription factor DksA
MKQERLNDYKIQLEKERLLLLEEIKQSEKPVSFGDDIDEFEEKTNETEEIGDQLAMARGWKLRVDDIDVALSKINSNTYGKCEKCGKEIEEEVLDISPETTLCKECAIKAEV